MSDFAGYKLKPCPFCGGTPHTSEGFTHFDDDEHNIYCIECKECDFWLSSVDYVEDVVEKWNRRVYTNDGIDTIEVRCGGETYIMQDG